jgi:multidrug transporter EmrE-like cation transporter
VTSHSYFPWILIILSALFDAYASYAVKYKFNELGEIKLGSLSAFFSYSRVLIQSPLFLSAVVVFILAPFLWFIALNRIQLSIGYPALVCFHLLFIYLISFFLLNEAFNIYKILGSLFLISSIFLFYKGN